MGSGVLLGLSLVSLYSASSESHLYTLSFDPILSVHEAACGSSVTKEITLCSASCSFMERKLQVLL